MIIVHRLNKTEFTLNDHHIETIEETPDTVITLTNDRKYVVTESTDEIIDKIVKFRQQIHKKQHGKD